MSPCYSLHNFHHDSHHLNHLQHESSITPDTDLSTPGPHLDNVRIPNSANIFNISTTAPRNENIHHFNSHQLQAEPLFFSRIPEVLASNILPNVEDPIQRPMSLPNYGGLNQIQQTQQPIHHYHLIDEDQNLIQTEQQQTDHSRQQPPWS